MKRGKVYQAGLIGTVGACLLAAGCSSSQKPAALGSTGATGSSSSSAATASATTPTQAATTSVSTTTSSGPAAPAPTTVATTSSGWSFTASVPGDSDVAGAMAAFQNYTAVVYLMQTKVENSNDLVKYADGNVLTLANNFVSFERQNNFNDTGKQTIKVTAVTKDAGNPPVVTINVCTDSTKYLPISNYGPNKGKLDGDVPTHAYPVTYRVHKGSDGKWRVNAVTAEPKTTC